MTELLLRAAELQQIWIFIKSQRPSRRLNAKREKISIRQECGWIASTWIAPLRLSSANRQLSKRISKLSSWWEVHLSNFQRVVSFATHLTGTRNHRIIIKYALFSTSRNQLQVIDSDFLPQYDIHLCAYSAMLRIVAAFHDEVFSDPSTPSGLNKVLFRFYPVYPSGLIVR